ncbi:BrnT family toxin [Paludibaculum fermentans]|uniref:BrnT family toxin n=1 Tax=Paludibaculum fermentans TaxID=1473598 RepID=A0A7S7SHA6_PALFE|nr:BrnT family toxin [Paludibaculum fermentans]QOY85687.1 BrnT family toxin [Paludibaculum fermentans]
MTRYEWDENKNRANKAKHGLSFETAILVFQDPYVLSEVERVVDGEERWQSIGLIAGTLIVLVIHTWHVGGKPGEIIRVISARKATSKEQHCYENLL